MKKIVDIILDKLNKDELSKAEMLNFLAFCYNKLTENNEDSKFIEQYKKEIENILADEKNKTSNITKKAKDLSIDIAKNIKKNYLLKIDDESLVFLILTIMFLCLLFCGLLEPIIFHGDNWHPLLIVFFVLSIVFNQCYIAIRKSSLASLLESKNISKYKLNTASSYYKRAYLYLKQNEYDKAINDYNKAIEFNPNKVSYYAERADLYAKQKEYLNAIKDYNKAIELNPNNAVYYSKRAKVYEQQNEYDKALTDYNKAIELNPSKKSYYVERDSLKKLIRLDEFKELQKQKNTHINNAQKYEHKQNYSKAIDEYTKAIELAPKDADLFTSRAELYFIIKEEYDKAISDYSKALELKPDNDHYYVQRANLYLLQGDELDKAIATFSRKKVFVKIDT